MGAFDDLIPAASGDIAGGAFDDLIPARKQPDAEAAGRSAVDIARDVGITALKGVIGVPQAAVGIADILTLGRAGKALEGVGFNPREAQEILDANYSAPQQAANRAVREADGFVNTLGAAIANPSTIGLAVGESIPAMLAGGVVARGLLGVAPKLAPWAAGALGEGVVGAGSAASQARGESADGTLTPKQAGAALASGAGTAAFGALGGKLAARAGLADVDTMLASGVRAATDKGFVRQIVGAGISEGVFEELPQSIQEQMWANYAAERPIMDGVGNSAAMGLLAGAAMGGAGGGFNAAMSAAQRRGPEPDQAGASRRPTTARSAAAEPDAATSSATSARSPGGDDARLAELEILAATRGLSPDEQATLAELRTAAAHEVTDEQALGSFADLVPTGAQARGGATVAESATSPAPEPTAAEQALREPVQLTALDRVDAIDRELEGSGIDPGQAEQLRAERETIASTWPKHQAGAPTSFSTEAGARLEGQYALVEADDLVTSHDARLRPNPLYPQELQPRDRSRAASEMQVQSIVGRLDPARLGVSADAATGAPIVGADGLIESGNARTIALKRVYQANGQKAADYRAWLEQSADQFGLKLDQVHGMRSPVLVRVRTTPVNRAEFARQANASTVQRMSPSEQALSDAKRLASLEGLEPTEDGDFTNSRDFIRQFMAMLPITEQNDMLEADGKLSTGGYRRIQNAVLAKAYGDAPTLRRMTESLDDNLRNVTKSLVRVAPTIAAARERMDAGTLHAADLAPDLLQAVEGLSAIKDKGWSVEAELGQGDIEGPRYSPEASQLLRFIADNIRSPRRIAEFLRAYYEALARSGDPSQGAIFGDEPAPTRAQLLAQAREGTSNADAAQDAERRLDREGTQAPAQGGRESADAARGRGGDQGAGATRAVAGAEGEGQQASDGVAADLAGEKLSRQWMAFAQDSGTLGVPRAEMPQIRAEHRGALVNFLAARGIAHRQAEVDARSLKPAQAEFSPAKVRKAATFSGGDRSILVSADGHVLDGHHQWLAKREAGEPVKVIRLDAPIDELLEAARDFPSATTDSGAAAAGRVRFSRREQASRSGPVAQAPNAPDAQHRQTERAYGGRPAYDRARASGRTKLTFGQWVQVRTPAFLRWFGDWELAASAKARSATNFGEARIAAQEFQGRSLLNSATGMTASVSRNSLDKMLSGKAVGKSESPQAHALAVANLDRLFERALLGWSKPDAAGDPNIVAIHRFFAPMLSDGRAMLAKMTVKETAQTGRANRLYTVEAVELDEKSPAAQWVGEIAGADGVDPRTIRSAGDSVSLAQRVEAFNRRASVSKVVDLGTGEPLVVYHGTTEDVTEFAPGPSGGLYFTPNREYAAQYTYRTMPGAADTTGGNVMAAFVALRNPQQRTGALGSAVLDAQEVAELERQGFDGLMNQDADEVVALRPQQVKSAIGNRGTFDPSSPDVRFSFAGQHASTADVATLAVARRRVAAGGDAEQVRRETGWHQGVDGQWRFEIDDSSARLVPGLLGNLGSGGYTAREISSVSYRREADGTYFLSLVPASPKKVSDIVSLSGIPEDALRDLLPSRVVQRVLRGEGTDDLVGDLMEARRIESRFRFQGFNAVPLLEALDHPALFAAYPSLADVKVMVDPALRGGAEYATKTLPDGTRADVITLGSMTLPKRALSALLHEVQHHIQSVEGFASGGSVEALAARLPDAQAVNDAEVLQAIVSRGVEPGNAAAEFLNMMGRDAHAAARSLMFESPAALNAMKPGTRYRLLAGEVEARNTQARQHLTAAQRRETPPATTADVREVDQVVEPNAGRQALAAGAMPVESVSKIADAVRRAWANGPDVVVVSDMSDERVPQRVRDADAEQRSQGATGEPEGFFYDGKVYLVASALGSESDVVRVLAHEALGHYGLRGVFGPELGRILDQIAVVRRSEVVAKLTEYGLKDTAAGRRVAAEEVLAVMAQTNPQLGFVRRAVATVRTWLRGLGLNLRMSDAEIIRNFILPARIWVERGGPRAARARLSFSPARSEAPGFRRSADAHTPGNASAAFSRSTLSGSEPPKIGPHQVSRWTALKARAMRLTDPEAIDRLVYELQDKFVDLKRLRERIQQLGGTVTDLNDAYLGEELYHARLAKRTRDFLDAELRPLLAQLRTRGVGMEEFETYLHARHAPEANRVLAERNPSAEQVAEGKEEAAKQLRELELQLQRAKARGLATRSIEEAIGKATAEASRWAGVQPFRGTEAERLSLSGMSDAEAQALMDGLKPDKRQHLETLAAMVDAMQARTLEQLEDYGLMDAGTLQAWRKTYEFYVPLHRDEARPESDRHPIGQGFSVKGHAARRRTGSGEKVTNILGHIAMQREAAITRGEKNQVVKRLYLLAVQNPDPQFWRLDEPPKVRTVDPATGFVRSSVDPRYKNLPNVVMLRLGGKDRAIVFNEHRPQAVRLAEAMKNLDVGDLHVVLGLAAKGTRWFASVNTQYNPIFGLVNFARDVQAGLLNLSTTALRGKQAEVARHLPEAMRAIYRERRGKSPTSQLWRRLWDEFQDTGGITGYRDLYADVDDRVRALTKELQALDRGRANQAAHAIVDWLSHYNEAMENAVRLAAYKTALDQGMTRERAASLAKNLTVNFNRKGRQAREIGALYAFFNAAIQGTARMAETLRGPTGRRIMYGGVLLGAVNALIGMAVMGGGGGDEPDNWEKIPEFVKERSLIIPLGREDYATIPMPLGFHVLPNIGRMAVEFALAEDDKSTGRRVGELMMVLVDAFNPLGGAQNVAQMVAPTVIDPAVALLQNRDWTGRPIYRENMSDLDPEPGHRRTKDSASTPSKLLSQAINRITGGTEYRPGMWSPTPDQLDYVIGQLTGGLGRELMKVNQSVASVFTGDELPPYKVPLLGRLYGNTRGPAGESAKFYENVRAINEVDNEIKGRMRNREDVAAVRRAEPLARLLPLALSSGGPVAEVRELRKQRRDILERKEPGYQDRVREVDANIGRAMARLNADVTRARRSAIEEAQ